jgi:hypothetical protein
MLNNAINSLNDFHNDVKLLIVCPENLHELLQKTVNNDKLELEILKHTFVNSDFCKQVNYGIDNCNTEWFTILEIDDEFKSVWLKKMNEYINENTDVDVFLPIVKDINVDGKFVSYTNESVWAYGFTEHQGFLDNDTLLEYQNYQTSGGLYRTNIIKENGSFKDNIKLTFSYEFLLRLTHNGVKVMVVPHVGYQHLNMREESLFWNYKNDETQKLSDDEVNFWLNTAKKEFFFKNKRDIDYVK